MLNGILFSIASKKKSSKILSFIFSDVIYLSDINYSCRSPSTNTSRSFLRDRKVHVNAFETLFQKGEAHYPKAAFFDELMYDGEVTLPRPRGVPVLKRETYEKPI